MANTVLGLAMRITASADGMREGITESEQLLKKLTRSAEDAGKGFENFRNVTTGELPESMTNLGGTLGTLAQEFLDGKVSADEFKASFKGITAEAKELTKAFEEGSRLTKSLRTEEERRADELENIARLEKVGAINAETANRARAAATGANQRAAQAAAQSAEQQRKAAAIIQSTLTPMERYGQEVGELDALLKAGLLTQAQYNRAVAQAQASYDKATAGATSFEKAADAVDDTKLKFNELSGILSALPGPFGAIAGRISGLASASEGLGRLFQGGFSQGLASAGASLAGLVDPATLALAGIAAAGAAITGLVRGLVALEDRVEKASIEAKKLGTSFEFMQQLEIAANRTGESVDTLRVGFTALLRNIDAARNGNKATAKAFADLGVSMDDLENKSPEEIFKAVGTSLNSIEDPALRTAAALKTVGENGGRLQPAFRALEEAAADIVRFNAGIDEFEARNITAMGDAFDDLSLSTQGLQQSMLTPFAGMIESISAGLAQAFATVSRNIGAILDAFSPLFTTIGIAIEQFLEFGSVLGNLIGLVLEPFAAAGATQNEILLVLGRAWRAVTTAINDGINYVREIVRAFFDWRSSSEVLSSAFEYIGEVLQRLGAIFAKVYERVAGFVSGFTARVAALIESSPLLQKFAAGMQAVFSAAVKTVVAFGEGFGWVVEQVLSFLEYLVGVDQQLPEVEVKVNDDELVTATETARTFYKEIDKAATDAANLGAEGFAAAVRYQEALQNIADLLAEGELTQEEADRGIENATKEYERQIDVIEKKQEAEKRAAEEATKAAQKAAEEHRKTVDRLLEEDRIRREFGGSNERVQADKNATALRTEIANIEQQIADARAAGDQAAVNALVSRLAKMEQLLQREQDVASGAVAAAKDVDAALKKANESATKAIDKAAEVGPETQKFIKDFEATMAGLSASLQLDLISPEEFEKAAEAAQKDFDKRVQNAQKINQLRQKLADEAGKIEAERVESLRNRIQEPLSIGDLRDDASIIFDALTGREDPAIEEYRKQLSKLSEIKQEISKLGTDTVEIA